MFEEPFFILLLIVAGILYGIHLISLQVLLFAVFIIVVCWVILLKQIRAEEEKEVAEKLA
ncbi:MAG: hypothetical protein UU76_C0001G0012 [Parcubacteria group bacterium GW2011_GWC1_41_7]|nr:MAG: hypothetical protein UU76_C0001G0012 [Parcubacteria group bacterium GW2011_GWC1_41_7]